MTVLITKQHVLPSLQFLISELEGLGFSGDTRLLEKHYSTVSHVLDKISKQVRIQENDADCFYNINNNNILLIDEGGGLHDSLPVHLKKQTASVEQTRFGVRANWKCPTVLVCQSAAKQVFESQIIGRGIYRKIESLGLGSDKIYGIVGLGALGAAIARLLLLQGKKVIGNEISTIPKDLKKIVTSLPELLNKSDIILGCTGTDISDNMILDGLSGTKIFISCSSQDIEFHNLLAKLPVAPIYDDRSAMIGNANIIILNGGFPINFDRTKEWELFDEIILTRQLVLSGLIQASTLIGHKAEGVMLNPKDQLDIVTLWLEKVPDASSLIIPKKLDEKFFINNSRGQLLLPPKEGYNLHQTTPAALDRMRSHNKPYEVIVNGLPITVFPEVWSPKYDWSSLFYIEHSPDMKNKTFLEIGSGTGVNSVFAARSGAKKVVATDINPEAVKNTLYNFERFSLKNSESYISDGFKSIKGTFDVVLWNAPYHGSKPASMLECGCADEDYKSIKAFFENVGDHLAPEGVVIFGFSESGDLPQIKKYIADNNLEITRTLSDWRQGYNCMLFNLVAQRPKNTQN